MFICGIMPLTNWELMEAYPGSWWMWAWVFILMSFVNCAIAACGGVMTKHDNKYFIQLWVWFIFGVFIVITFFSWYMAGAPIWDDFSISLKRECLRNKGVRKENIIFQTFHSVMLITSYFTTKQ